MRLNTRATVPQVRTYEGGRADSHQTSLQELERAVSTCLLWENTFYEKGSQLAARIADLCGKVLLPEIASLALKARTDLKLRHVPLFLCVQMARINSAQKLKSMHVAQTLSQVIQRPDEITEFLSMYWQQKKVPLAKQVKLGLAGAFQKFSAFQLAKWNRSETIKLRDALFLVHAKPKDAEQAATWKLLVENALPIPDTWEVALSAGEDKKQTWERLLQEKKLGYMALLMNLRNMDQAGVDPKFAREALLAGAVNSRALPFRFLSAAKHAPMYADTLSQAMCASITDQMPGRTVILIDISGSMDPPISQKSTLSRWESAASLAVLLREMTPECRVFTFSSSLVEVMNVRGIPLVQAIGASQTHGSTHLAHALEVLQKKAPLIDRLIVITDEQTHDGILRPWTEKAYLVNVAPYAPGLETSGGWQRINGWSEQIPRWMAYTEGQQFSLEESENG